jgi:hypothetical protein
MIASSQQNR